MTQHKALQPVRGTHDYLGEDMRLMRHIMDTARRITALYGAEEVQTPVFEFSEVFHRSLGDTSDVVSKETYTFTDRGGESLTLRPEFTAAIVRAFISNGLTQQLPWKAFYAGPAFRYERPQKGRMRQFHQIGVEWLGVPAPWWDVEVIACAAHVLRTILADVPSLGITLEINTLGDAASRFAYREALLAYFTRHAEALSEESRTRLVKNPLRILDSKQETDKEVVAGAPLFASFLSAEAGAWWAAVQEGLHALAIPFTPSPRLVRGLDYCAHTVFEFTTTKLGAQATILAGGRYDGLVEQLGGPPTTGMGFAAGVERLLLLLQQTAHPIHTTSPVHLACITPDAAFMHTLMPWVAAVRAAGIIAEIMPQHHIGKAIKKAEASGATHVLVYGENEHHTQTVTVKTLATRTTTAPLTREALVAHLMHHA